MYNPGTKTNTFALFTDETLCDYEEPENLLLQPYDEVMNLHGPCKGIFFVVNEHGKLALLNLATKQLKEIPSPEIDAPYHVYSNRFGFGVDPSSCCHFKVIMFRHFVDMAAYNDLDNEDLEDDLSLEESQTYYPLHIGVYTSRTNSWRYFDQDSTDLVKSKRYVIPSLTDTCLDGKYYWVTAYETDDAFGGVIAFDMETESFSNIPVPRSAKREIFYLALCCGSIALLSYDTASSIDLWLMKDGCWSKDFNINPPLAGFNVKKPVALWKEDGIIFVDHEKHLIMYNLISKEYKIIGVKPKADILSSAGPSAFAYKESLMPL